MHKTDTRQLGAIVRKNSVLFRVWAPFASAVSVTGSFNDWAREPMEAEEGGYWYVEVKGAKAGQEYKYAIRNGDEELVRNDPRAFQLTTTTGGSSVIADTSFDWGDTGYSTPALATQVLYELHIGTFHRPDPSTNGTFKDAIDKLDYLKELGINMIELMPVASMSSDRGWGYAPDYIYAVESMYGGRNGLLAFVKEAHSRGIGVVLDVVYNHFGPDSTSLDIWRFDGWSQNDKGGIYFYNDWRSPTPWGDTRPDYGRPEVQDYILDNVAMWIADCRLDGLRVDSTIFMRNVQGQHNDPANDLSEGWHILQRLTSLARKINPDALLIAEDVGANDYITAPDAAGGAGFTAQWELGFPHMMRAALGVAEDSQRNLGAVCDMLCKTFNSDPFQRIIYADSHDTAANGGSRLAEEISPGEPTSVFARKRSLLAAALMLTAPGIPMLFQGQEFMEGGSFNDWEGMEWEKAETFAGVVLAHRHLIDLRKNAHRNTGGLTGRHINVLHNDGNNNVLAYHRWDNGGTGDDTLVVINFNNHKHEEYRVAFPHGGLWQVRFNSAWNGYSADFKDMPQDSVVAGDDGGGSIKLAPYSVLIFSQDA
jgi:1,4-alpha-glucan branching enzyme